MIDGGAAERRAINVHNVHWNLFPWRGFVREATSGEQMANSEFFMSYLIWRMRIIAADCGDARAKEHLRLLVNEIEEQESELPIAVGKPKKTEGRGETT
jgi:hypothetical protein